MTLEEFQSLEVGDQVETVAIMPALSEEPVILQTVGVQPDRKEFVATYHGITLGRWVCTNKEGALTWAL